MVFLGVSCMAYGWMVRGIKRQQLNNSILHSATFWYFVGLLFGIVFQGLHGPGVGC
jgi:hypothetical protein